MLIVASGFRREPGSMCSDSDCVKNQILIGHNGNSAKERGFKYGGQGFVPVRNNLSNLELEFRARR
jgi:hypothetical protein